MTDARDELAELIRKAITDEDVLDKAALGGLDSDCAGYDWAIHAEAAADAILTAGWRAPLPSAPDCDRHRWRSGACVECGVQCEHRHVTHAKRCGLCGQSQLTLDEALERAHRLSGW